MAWSQLLRLLHAAAARCRICALSLATREPWAVLTCAHRTTAAVSFVCLTPLLRCGTYDSCCSCLCAAIRCDTLPTQGATWLLVNQTNQT